MANNVSRAPQGILEKALTGNIWISQNLAFMNEGDKDGYSVYKHDLTTGIRAKTDDPSFFNKWNFREVCCSTSINCIRVLPLLSTQETTTTIGESFNQKETLIGKNFLLKFNLL